MQIEVHTTNPGGLRVIAHLEVDPDEGVESIKSKIHRRLDILPYQQRLTAIPAEGQRRGRSPVSLETGSCLRDYGLTQDGTAINVQVVNREGIEVTVKKLGGKVTLSMYPPVVSTVLHVKRMISDLEGTPPDHQHLVHAGRTLDNNQTLANYGFTERGNTIDLVPKVCHRFSCISCAGKDIMVQLPSGQSFQLEVDPAITVETLKDMIKDKGEIPPDHQALKIGTKVIEDGHKLGEYQQDFRRNKNEPLRVHLSHMVPICFKLYTGKSLRMNADIYHPVESLKLQLESVGDLSRERLCLVLDGKLLEDHSSLRESGIQDNSVIIVGLRLQTQISITVKTLTGRSMTLVVDSRGTVGDVKVLIAEKVGVPEREQQLFYRGRRLEDRSTLAECGAQNDSVFCVVYCLFGRQHINIATITGSTFRYEVDAIDSVLALKQQLHKAGHVRIPPEDQRLVFQGHRLEDQYTICDYGIRSGSTLHLISRSEGLLRLLVRTLSQQSFNVEVEAQSTVESLKDAIERKTGVPSRRQCLLFAGREMENDRALSDYSLPDRSTLHLISSENV